MRLAGFLIGVFALAAALTAWPHVFAYPKTPAARWLQPVFYIQDYIAQEKPSGEQGRIIISAGSNGLFGFDGDTLERLTGKPVINASSHAAMSLSFHEARALAIVQPGDTVILPLELEYFERPETTRFQQQQNLIWLLKDYPAEPPLTNFRQTWETPSETLARLALTRLVTGQTASPFQSPEEAISAWQETPSDDVASGDLYRYQRIDQWGFIQAREPLRGNGLEARDDPHRYDVALRGSRFETVVSNIAAYKARVERRGGRLLVTYPALMATGDGLSFNKIDDSQAALAQAVETLIESGVEHVCHISTALLPPGLFLDTRYHVNAWGGTVRSQRLAQCLRDLENGVLPVEAGAIEGLEINWRAVLTARQSRAQPLMAWERRILDMYAVADALEAYRKENGAYPRNLQWQNPGAQWIEGLAPDYIDALPTDPALETPYLYRSNGSQYKLLVIDPDNAELVGAVAPSLKDGRRRNAYGLWTSNAVDW